MDAKRETSRLISSSKGPLSLSLSRAIRTTAEALEWPVWETLRERGWPAMALRHILKARNQGGQMHRAHAAAP